MEAATVGHGVEVSGHEDFCAGVDTRATAGWEAGATGCAQGWVGRLLTDGQHGQKQKPGGAQGVPVPGGGVHGDLAEFHLAE